MPRTWNWQRQRHTQCGRALQLPRRVTSDQAPRPRSCSRRPRSSGPTRQITTRRCAPTHFNGASFAAGRCCQNSRCWQTAGPARRSGILQNQLGSVANGGTQRRYDNEKGSLCHAYSSWRIAGDGRSRSHRERRLAVHFESCRRRHQLKTRAEALTRRAPMVIRRPAASPS